MNLASRREEIRKKLKQYFSKRDDLAAVYLFGSLARGEPVANDVDILILPIDGAERDEAVIRTVVDLSAILCLPEEKLDVILFSLEEVDLEVLYNAVDKGELLIEKDSDFLGDMLEKLSHRMVESEPFRVREKQSRLKEFFVDE